MNQELWLVQLHRLNRPKLDNFNNESNFNLQVASLFQAKNFLFSDILLYKHQDQ